jgi:hypothetical protein
MRLGLGNSRLPAAVFAALGVALLLVCSRAAFGQTSDCWIDVPKKSYYGSADQVQQLKQIVTRSNCPILGFSYRTPERIGLVVFERASGDIFRLNLWTGDARVMWERWSGATPKSISADDPDDGFDSGIYTQPTNGRAPMSAAVRRFLGMRAPPELRP